MLTKWHDKVAAFMLVGAMVWFTITTGIQYYKEIKHEQYKAILMKAKDPLTIASLSTEMQVLKCGGTLQLPRYTTITKPLTVTVNRKIIRVDSEIVDQETTHLPDITYTDTNIGGRTITYNVVTPRTLTDGTYLYVPTLTYKVNEFLTITKPAPSQVFKIVRPEGCAS